jgi:hypothetical protein
LAPGFAGAKISSVSRTGQRRLTAAVVSMAAASAWLSVAPAASANTIAVGTTSDGVTSGCSLRSAIASVNAPETPSGGCAAAQAVGNTITLGAGTYTLSIKPAGPDDNTTGDLDIASSVAGLVIKGVGAGTTTIDASGLGDRIFDIAAGASVTLEDLTLTGGQAPAGIHNFNADGATGAPGGNGGAIENAGTLTLNDVVVTASDAGAGALGDLGSASSDGGTGGSGGSGGGVYNTGTLTLDGTTLSDDHAGTGGQGGSPSVETATAGIGGSGGDGGGLSNSGTATIENGSTLTDDAAGGGGAGGEPAFDVMDTGPGGGGAGGAGGGAYTSGPSLEFEDSTASDDAAGNGGIGSDSQDVSKGAAGGCGGDGGGLADGGSGSFAISASTIASDDAGVGGRGGQGAEQATSEQISSAGGTGCAGGSGGGVSDVDGSLDITNSTITAAFAGTGGAGGPGGETIADPGMASNGGAGGAAGSGGAIFVSFPSTPTVLLNVTIAQNGIGSPGVGGTAGGASNGGIAGTAGAGGATGVGGGLAVLTPLCVGACVATKLQNTIVAEDAGGNCFGNATSPIVDEGHNVTFGDTSCPGTVGDPKLGSLQNNGGDTETLALGQGSAAIDEVPASGAGCPATDQRGLPRPSGPACDAGAYELTPPSATTGPASAIRTTGATVAATVSANDGTATVEFKFGTSMAYGHETAAQSVGGLVATSVTAALTGLTPGTTYHYRVVATSADGTTDGADRTFTAAAVAPVLRVLKLSPATFAAAASGASIARRASVGTAISYDLSSAANTTLTVSRTLSGVRVRGRCVAPPRHGHVHGRACKRLQKVGSFTHAGVAGRNEFKFSGRVSGRRLRPGGYQLAATPRANGLVGKTATASFRIVA